MTVHGKKALQRLQRSEPEKVTAACPNVILKETLSLERGLVISAQKNTLCPLNAGGGWMQSDLIGV